MPQSNTPRLHAVLKPLFVDLHHALRTLLRDRSFTFTAIGTLTLAIALNVAGFTLMQAMLIRGYPLVERNEQLVYIQERGALGCCVAYGNFVDWRREATSFKGMAFVGGRQLTLRDESGGRERLSAPIVSTDLFRLLAVQPALGRDFIADDEKPNAAPVAILSYGFWQRHFRGSADVIGRTLKAEEATLTVVGVMPEGFSFPEHQDLWMPLPRALTATGRSPSGFLVVARLAEGATVASAQAELTTISARLADEYPRTNRGVMPEAKPHAEFFFGDGARALYGSMWTATWFVLLIACANLVSLNVARTTGRAHELSTRLALGAGHWRLSRQMLAENVLIVAVAGIFAWWIAKWSVAAYSAATASVHYVLDFTMGHDVLLYLVAIAIAACVLFTLVPVANLWRIDSIAILKGARGATPALSRKQAALIIGQMVFAMVLLSGSGVLVRSFMRFETASVGIDAEHVLVAAVELPKAQSTRADTSAAFVDSVEARLEMIPGIERVSTASHRPLAGALTRALDVEGETPAGESTPPRTASAVLTGPDYFRVVGATILGGRDFAASDVASGIPVAIVNQRFAEMHWPGEEAVGKRVRLRASGEPDGAGKWLTVVGVASNIMQTDPTRQSYAPLVYLPLRQTSTDYVWVLAKTTVPPSLLAGAIRRELRNLDPDLYVSYVASLEQTIAFSSEFMDVAHQHLGRNAALFPIFAACALLLAGVGLYAMVSQSVGRRTREIGVRMAIGATGAQIWRWVLRQGLRPALVGLVVGFAVSLAVNRVLASQLIGVKFYDPVTMAVAPAVLVVVALLACRIPARQAMRVDPAVALRRD